MSESPLGEADGSTLDAEIYSSVECPTCGRDDFKSNRGMRRHHAMMHGESLSKVEFECSRCGRDFARPLAWVRKDQNTGEYCSRECKEPKESRECANPDCDSVFEVGEWNEKEYCSETCSYGHREIDGAHTQNCEICGSEYETGGESKAERRKTCSKECFAEYLSENYTGKDSPTWKGGSVTYYGSNWRKQRNKARKRDNYTCQVCGVKEEDNPRELSVHHITPANEFDDLEKANKLLNLVTLCEPCHQKWEGLYLRPDTRHVD